MTIKPVQSQKTTKHDKKEDVQQQIAGSNGRRTQQISTTPKSPSPQREQKQQSRGGVNTVNVYDGGRRRRSSPHRISSVNHRNKRNNGNENVVVVTRGERGEKIAVNSGSCPLGISVQGGIGGGVVVSSSSGGVNDLNTPCSSGSSVGLCKSPKSNSGSANIDNTGGTGCGNLLNINAGNNSGNIGSNNNSNIINSNINVNSNNLNNNNNNGLLELVDDALSGYNSGDEHIGQKDNSLTIDEWTHRDETFQKLMSTERGFIVKEIGEDGACLFRSISLQIYGDEEMHEVIRQQTMDYIYQNREYFAQFVTEDISAYVKRKRENHVHGNHIEIQAISEIYNRAVELYCYKIEPINIFNSDQLKNGYEPFRLSYQRGSHYNAILNPYKPCVGVGLGLAGYRPDEPDVKQMRDAVRLSEDLEIEQTMFEDKLKTTDWEATNEVMEEQIARESYLQWCRDNMQKKESTTCTTSSSSSSSCSSSMNHQKSLNMNASSSTITSSDLSGNKSPNCSGESSFESEDYTPYPSDTEEQQKHCDFGESSSSASAKKATETIYYLHKKQQQQQQQDQRQRRRKRRRGCGGGTNVVVAGPSYSTPNSIDQSNLHHKHHPNHHSPPKMVKFGRRSIILDESPEKSDMPGTSKQNLNINDKPMSAFYHSLLESSYNTNNKEILGNQLSEEEMIRKALQMSRMDFMQKLRADSPAGPSSP